MYGIDLTSEKLSIEHSKVTKCVIMSLLLLLFQYYTFAGLWYVTYHFCGKSRQMIIFISSQRTSILLSLMVLSYPLKVECEIKTLNAS